MENSQDASISPFLAVLIGCCSAFILSLFIFCKRYLQQNKKKDSILGLAFASNPRKQRLDSAFENCECCCKDEGQVACTCNSNNNSNSLSANDPDGDSNNALIFDRASQKQNESLLDTVSVERAAFDGAKVNYQNSLDIASLDEYVVEEDDQTTVAVRLDENENRSFEIIKPDEKQLAKQLSLNSEKPIKVILKLHKRNLPLKLHSQSIELINEKPSTKAHKLVPLLRRASLNIGALVRQKSFDLTEEEEAVCQDSDVSKRGACFTGRDLARESIREAKESAEEPAEGNENEPNNSNNFDSKAFNNKNPPLPKSTGNNGASRSELVVSRQLSASSDEKRIESLNKSNRMMADRTEMDETTDEATSRQNDQNNSRQNKLEAMSKSFDSFSSEEARQEQVEYKSGDYPRQEYKGEDYKIIWDLRATLENEMDKDNDSCGDLSETGELVKQRSVENAEEHVSQHELIKNVSLASSSSADQKLSVDSGYKSIERRDYSIDSKTESVYRQFTGGSSSLSKEFSLGSISNQNISLSSANSILDSNLDVKNYKNQYSIKEEPEDEQKITFV